MRQLYIVVLIFGFLVIGLVSYVFFRRFRSKKEEEQKEIETRLELENFKTLQKAELAEVKNTLYANVSHEFRTPLTLIQVPIQNYLKKAAPADIPVFDSVLKNTGDLLKMIDELLDLSKMETGTVELQKSVFNLTHFLTQIKSNFTPLFKEKNIQLTWDVSFSAGSFNGDENRLKMVLNNILKNAYSHTPQNGFIECAVSINENQGLKIRILNSGDPINQKDLPYIFDRYYRADEFKYSGTGIGLAMSRQIVEMHGGSIQVRNIEGTGVAFEVLLPAGFMIHEPIENGIYTAANGNGSMHHITTNGSELAQKSDRSKILVVEDNAEMRNLLKGILNEDFELSFGNDGEEGEKLAQTNQPDLVLSDVMMPKKDGFELLNVLKNNFGTSHIPVVLLTARADSTSRISGLNQDADDYIGKPFDAIELKARINNLLRQRKNLHKLFSENPLLYSKEIKCTPLDAEFIDKARQILENNYGDGDFSVNAFCAELALNRNSVNNKLNALANQSTAEYIKNFRLEKALKMLVETDTSISGIYVDCGFNSPQSFNKVFKKKYGCTPSEYRLQKQS